MLGVRSDVDIIYLTAGAQSIYREKSMSVHIVKVTYCTNLLLYYHTMRKVPALSLHCMRWRKYPPSLYIACDEESTRPLFILHVIKKVPVLSFQCTRQE